MTKKEARESLISTKVYVAGKSREIQEKLLGLGIHWISGNDKPACCNDPFLYISSKGYSRHNDMDVFAKDKKREVTADYILNLQWDDEDQFKPFDKILVRNNDKDVWVPRLFSNRCGEYYITCMGSSWLQCIPYEGNEHIVGTSDEPVCAGSCVSSAPSVDSQNETNKQKQADPLANWNDSCIYPVWKDETKPHTLDNLEGIHVPVIDGSEILLYPKYKECALLPKDKVDSWSAKRQCNPLYAEIDQRKTTDELLSLGSEAAKFVRQFGKDVALPIQLLAIAKHKEKIDKLSSLLGGDLLSSPDVCSIWWSLLRYHTNRVWYVYGANGSFDYGIMHYGNQCLPVSPYKKP